MNTQVIEPISAGQSKDKDITVTVNERPVIFDQHQTSGLEIKRTAIAQGLPIQEDFVLFEVKGPGHLKPIEDAEPVTLHNHQAFRAVTPDDKS
jgi:outer membrane protein assembly factor BamA